MNRSHYTDIICIICVFGLFSQHVTWLAPDLIFGYQPIIGRQRKMCNASTPAVTREPDTIIAIKTGEWAIVGTVKMRPQIRHSVRTVSARICISVHLIMISLPLISRPNVRQEDMQKCGRIVIEWAILKIEKGRFLFKYKSG